MPFEVWDALGQVMKEIKFRRERRQSRGNVKRRQGDQKYAIRVWIYAYKLKNMKKKKGS